MRLVIDFGGTNIKIGLVDDAAEFLARVEMPLSYFPVDDQFIDAFMKFLTVFLAGRKPRGIGMATKGGVLVETAEVASDIGAGQYLVGIDLRGKFESRFGVPFVLDNDARAYALGAYHHGAGQGAQTMLCLTLGTGVGSALIQNGKAFMTADPVGGLLGGHVSIDPLGKPCACGNRGCLEGLVSATALHEVIRTEHPQLLEQADDPIGIFFQRGLNGPESPLGASVQTFQKNLAQGLVNLIHVYGPDKIVIGGGVAKSAEGFLPAVRAQVAKMAWTSPRGRTEIIPTHLGNKAALLGMAFHPLLVDKLS